MIFVTFGSGYRISSKTIWNDYMKGKQTYLQLAKKYKCFTKPSKEKYINTRLLYLKAKPKKTSEFCIDATIFAMNLSTFALYMNATF